MEDYESLHPDQLDQAKAHEMAQDIIDHLDPSTIENDSMMVDYRMLKKKMRDHPERDFHQYELEKLVPIYKHWVRRARRN